MSEINKNNLLLSYQLCFALYSASNTVMRAYNNRLKKYGLTYTQYLVLLVLWEVPGLTIKKLSGKLKLDSGSLSPIIKRMHRNGLILKIRSSEDERSVHIRLTQKAKKIRDNLSRIQYQISCETGLTEQGYGELRDAVLKLQAELDTKLTPKRLIS